jgi:glycosyltransferase involved in cell wall biosynthesis
MKITIVMGFFLPVPPESGGATEKSWHRLAAELAARGHEVTVISRTWRRWLNREVVNGVRHRRLPGFDHRRKLWQNLLLDFIWSCRVHRDLPDADIVVVHSVLLPVWLGRLRPKAGRVVVMPGRMPKGQYRWYRKIARVLATSTPVEKRVLTENPSLRSATRIFGYPIDWQQLALPRTPSSGPVTIGFTGRLHPEKGLELLAAAAQELAAMTGLPPWRLILCGPEEISAGGAGPQFRTRLERQLRAGLPEGSWAIRPPVYRENALAAFYRTIDVFCYPSLAAQGETFGVAVAEAMAAGAAPVVSDLACFRDFVRSGANGLVFDHAAPDASSKLAAALASLVRDPVRRQALATAAQADVQRYDFPRYAETLLEDFTQLMAEAGSPALTT